MDEQRALLDSLMGVNRNRDRASEEIRDFRDPRVCKFHLMGMCPHEMFVNTKMDIGPCPNIHSDELADALQKSSDPYIFDSIIERDFTGRINDIDRTIKRARARVEEDKSETTNIESNPDLLRIHEEIDRYTAEAGKAGDDGDIDKALELMAKVDLLNQEKEQILTKAGESHKNLLQRTGVDVNKKLRVCDVCGSFLSILDSDKRLADHFMGKQHIGYQTMRDAVDAIRQRRESKGSAIDEYSDSRDQGGSSGRRDYRDRDRDRERDRGRGEANYRDYRDRGSPRYRGGADYDRGGREDGNGYERERDRGGRDDGRSGRDRDSYYRDSSSGYRESGYHFSSAGHSRDYRGR